MKYEKPDLELLELKVDVITASVGSEPDDDNKVQWPTQSRLDSTGTKQF